MTRASNRDVDNLVQREEGVNRLTAMHTASLPPVIPDAFTCMIRTDLLVENGHVTTMAFIRPERDTAYMPSKGGH